MKRNVLQEMAHPFLGGSLQLVPTNGLVFIINVKIFGKHFLVQQVRNMAMVGKHGSPLPERKFDNRNLNFF